MKNQVVEQVATVIPTGAAREKWLAEGSHIEPDAPPEEKKVVAAVEVQEVEEKKPEPRVSRSEKRIIELLGKVKELEDKIGKSAQPSAEEKKPAQEVEKVEAKPELKDFQDVEQYVEALTAYNTKAAIKEYETRRATADAEAAVKKANEEAQASYMGKVDKARERYEDFDEVAFAPELPIKAGSVVDAWILDSEQGIEMLYHLGKNPKELERINGLKSSFAQARELTKLELSLSGVEKKSAAPPEKKVFSEAPPPASRVDGEKAATGDESRQAVMEGDVRAYIAAENAKDLKRSRRG